MLAWASTAAAAAVFASGRSGFAWWFWLVVALVAGGATLWSGTGLYRRGRRAGVAVAVAALPVLLSLGAGLLNTEGWSRRQILVTAALVAVVRGLWLLVRQWTWGEWVAWAVPLVAAHSRIAQFELGNETPPADVSTKLDALLGAGGDLTDLWGHIKRTPYPDWARAFMAHEAKAIKMLKYMAHAVPGLLQTEAYARALLRISRPRDTDAQIEELVSARTERQAILGGSAPPLLWCILDEAVIRRAVGGLTVMRDQLDHLLCMAQTPDVVLQVLPFSKGEHPVMGGSLTLLSFERGQDVAYTEGSHSGELVETPEEVAEYALAYDLLQAKALPPDESLAVIRSVMEE